MRFLGIYWLGKTLYPELVSINLYDKTKEFYKLFLYLDLSDDEIKDILNEKI
ncbi:hypothetical protein [Campylobacter corcagiensis]|uniref:hypothetical protein n=1 Tax=Campylobacter corcagiensis TaxID=1448857 RepID=UPI0004B96D94|nr:hypothetical protein [Campylobacter corcagiensis]